jgi:serine/threonine protein kinase
MIMADRVGQQLGNYRLIRLLGKGGFAEVYLGEHLYLKNRAALKVLRASLADEDAEQFLAEAQTLARLAHPNIVRVLDFAVEQGIPFLVMEYAPRGTIRQHHPRGSCLSLETATSYVKQVAAALQYAHNRNVIHRDIKPENMLLGPHQNVLLSDFGLALFSPSPELLSTQEMSGTLPYMAPEQIRGKPRFASDQYSLGIVVYEWLCGVRPFEGSAWQIANQHLSASPPPLREKDPSLPEAVEEVVLKALAKNPEQRYVSMQMFAQAFERASQQDERGLQYDSEVTSPLHPIELAPSAISRRIFLSASQADDAFVARLKADVQKRGMVIWNQPQETTVDETPHEGELARRGIRAADIVLLVASPHARASRAIKEHLQIAGMYRRPMLCIWAAGNNMIEALPSMEEQPSIIDARQERYETALAAIVAYLEHELPDYSSDESYLTEPIGELREPRNPYKGLRAFTKDDASDFFGRDALIAELTGKVKEMLIPEQPGMHAARVLAVIGPSGSGKSSVVMAGLLPRLQQGALPGSEQWIYLEPMVPGSHPLEALTLTLAPHFSDKSLKSLREDLEDDSARGLHLLAAQLSRKPEQKVVLLVDQFEELFTQTTSEDERRHFIDLLTTAATEPHSSVILLLTLRADLYDRPMAYPELGRLILGHQAGVLAMDIHDLRAVIKQPAALPDVQLIFEGNLVGDLLYEVQGQIGALPLLQFTLDQLFERRKDRMLTYQAYTEIGGVKGALAKHAESTYTDLPSEKHRKLARSLFMRLIDPGLTEQDTTRRRAALSELTLSTPEETELLQQVTAYFLAARLLTANEIAGTSTIEVSHEALIHEWTRLSDWLWEAREDIRLQHAISEDAAEWEQRGNPRDRLYRGSQLKDARAWARSNIPSKSEVAFLNASAARRTRFVFSLLALVLLLATSTGIAGWLFLHQPVDPTHVTTLKDSGPGSLRQAIVAAKPGGMITFDASLRGTIMLMNEDLNITKSLDIHGPGAGVLSISGGDRNPGLRVFVFSDASVAISGLTFKDTKTTGKCLITNAGTLTLTNSMISDNTTFPGGEIGPGGSISCRGGGIENDGMLTLTNSVVSGNTGPNGGGIFNDGTLKLINSTVSHNTASGEGTSGTYDGGGIYNGGTLTLINSTVSGNTTSQGSGGGIWNGLDTERPPRLAGGTLMLTNSTVSGNSAAGDGGGIYNDGPLTITSSTISGNMASDNGGGIYNGRSSIVNGMAFGGMLTLINSTISDNTATTNGGGIVFGGTQASIIFCTIYGNKTAHNGGGISIQDFNFSNKTVPGQVDIRNSIVAGNHADSGSGSDILGTLTLSAYNLIQDLSGANLPTDPSSKGNIVGLSPNLGSLQNNGGSTQTLALLPGSPVIDKIPLDACHINGITTDQRGVRRPQGSACDIGAYEYKPS